MADQPGNQGLDHTIVCRAAPAWEQHRMKALMVAAEAILGLCIGFGLAGAVYAVSAMPPPTAAVTADRPGFTL